MQRSEHKKVCMLALVTQPQKLRGRRKSAFNTDEITVHWSRSELQSENEAQRRRSYNRLWSECSVTHASEPGLPLSSHFLIAEAPPRLLHDTEHH